jgi:hypothetical protein
MGSRAMLALVDDEHPLEQTGRPFLKKISSKKTTPSFSCFLFQPPAPPTPLDFRWILMSAT